MRHYPRVDQPAATTTPDPVGLDNVSATSAHRPAGSPPDRSSMKLIPWPEIWTSLRIARNRGNGEMIEVFYDTLFKEAIFDDDGAWALDLTKTRNDSFRA
jgi:hypothetical protein